MRCEARTLNIFYHEASGDKKLCVRYARRPRRTRESRGRGARYARKIFSALYVSYVCMQSSWAHDVPHYTVQALRARKKRAVVLPNAFGLLASVAGWTFA